MATIDWESVFQSNQYYAETIHLLLDIAVSHFSGSHDACNLTSDHLRRVKVALGFAAETDYEFCKAVRGASRLLTVISNEAR